MDSIFIQLQGKDRLVIEMFGLVKFFKLKMKQFSIQLLQGEIGHFLTCLRHIPKNKHNILGKRYASKINLLVEEFNKRFVLFKEDKL